MTIKRKQREASVKKLLDAAQHLFVSGGYSWTNLEQIAEAAGLSKGAVYFYFGKKENVLLGLLNRAEKLVVDEAIEKVEQAGPGMADKLVAFVHYQAGLGITHCDEVLLLILMSLEFGKRAGKARARISQIYSRMHTFIERLIRAGQKAGEFRCDVPTHELAAIVMANNDGAFLEWYRRKSTLNGPNLVRALRSVVLSGVCGQPVRPSTRVRARTTRRKAAPLVEARV